MSGDCGDREQRLVSLLYEDGDAAELAEIRGHLATCAACRDEFEKLTSTRELLAAWPDVVNAPRVVYVNESPQVAGSIGEEPARRGWSGLRSFLPSLAAAAMVALLLVGSASVLRFQVGPDGRLRVGFGSASGPAAEASAFVTRGDLDQGLAQTAAYLETLVRNGREQDRQAVLDAVGQTLQSQNDAMGKQVSTAINSAFDEIDRRRRADLSVVLSSMSDLQAITRSELQQINAVLASLAPAPSANQE